MRRRALIQLLCALLLLLALGGAYAAWYAEVGKMSGRAAALARDLSVKGSETAQLADARDALERLAADEGAMRAYRVAESDIVSFLSALETTGTSLGSDVEVVSVSAEPGENPAIQLSLSIRGSFDAVLRTLGAIEHGPYDSRVEQVTLDTVPQEDGAPGAWTAAATFRIGTHRAPAPAES
jgi:hypothetical protein